MRTPILLFEIKKKVLTIGNSIASMQQDMMTLRESLAEIPLLGHGYLEPYEYNKGHTWHESDPLYMPMKKLNHIHHLMEESIPACERKKSL